jgi:diguanylate cyclase (GGDEF)-like protein/putative nucleotidyltransferase with HDIG domain
MNAKLELLRGELKRYPPIVLVLTGSLAGIAGVILALSVRAVSANWRHVCVLALLSVIVAFASSRHSLELKSTHSGVSIANCLVYLLVIVYGPYEAVLVAAVDAFVGSRRLRSRPLVSLFNISNITTSVFVAGSIFRFAGGYLRIHGPGFGPAHPILVFALPLIGLALTHYVCNYTSLALMLKLVFGTPFRNSIWRKLPWEPMAYIAEATAAGVVYHVALNYDLITVGVTLVLAIPVPILIYYTFKAYKDRLEERDRHYKELTDINDSILEMLAMAVDAKDQTTHDHLQRVKLFARRLGEILGISEADMNALKAGALLHDIGKIGVPAYILNKPGKLTQHEFEQMKMHTIIGADMLSNIKFGYPVAPVVRHHHERWDGQGYPDGLAGEQIPITARILTLVDCYDALRSDRPYHKAMTREKALKYLADNKEVFFDPNLVDIFISEVDDLEAQAARFKSEAKKLSQTTSAALRSAIPATGLDTSDTSRRQNRVTAALNTIAEANQRVSELYEITRNLAGAFSLDDTSAILSNRLSKLLPFTTCAVSLFDANRSEFEIVHADGRHAEGFSKRRLPISAGITGWVIQNQRPMYNTNPLLDLGFLDPDAANEYKAVMVFPLVKNEGPIGAIALYSTEIPAYTSEFIQLMESIAQPIADSIANALAFEQARRAAMTDPVTGLSNMAAFAASFEREHARSSRSGMPLSVVVATVNNLAEAAAQSGRRDEDLMGSLGRLVKARLRESDLIARKSASSFILLLTDSGRHEALEVLARMHDTIAQDEQGAALSIDIGAATSPDDGETLDDLLRRAVLRSLPVKEVLSELGLTESSLTGSSLTAPRSSEPRLAESIGPSPMVPSRLVSTR